MHYYVERQPMNDKDLIVRISLFDETGKELRFKMNGDIIYQGIYVKSDMSLFRELKKLLEIKN